jgi:radical SAM protein with 4Fe4S-binding SPASM domain
MDGVNELYDENHLTRIYDTQYKFYSAFDPNTGFYWRSGVVDENGKETTEDPFMASFPPLLDIGIMGHCEHGLSGKCLENGIQCYQDGLHIKRPNMKLEDFKRIIDECSGRVFQIALGGRGDPDMHEEFEEILAYSRMNGIVPNLTTSGYCLTKEKAEIIKRYCGAAAVSWYRTKYTSKAIKMLLEAGVKTNIHFVLSNSTIEEAILMIKSGIPKGVNRLILLLFKPVGLGSSEEVLSPEDQKVKELFSLFKDKRVCNLAGFDSCSVPAMICHSKGIAPESYDGCEAARFSAYISSDMIMLPCSFDQDHRWAVDIRDKKIEAAWNRKEFSDFREQLRSACKNCDKRDLCMGGCPIKPEITLCENKKVGDIA